LLQPLPVCQEGDKNMGNAEIERVRLRVTGIVQGVFFRASTRERAVALGLSGWVRNAPDGAVELEAQGDAAQVEALIAWCHQGPPAARVDGVEVARIPAPADARPGVFEIRR
jgi:acylphosphatase